MKIDLEKAADVITKCKNFVIIYYIFYYNYRNKRYNIASVEINSKKNSI